MSGLGASPDHPGIIHRFLAVRDSDCAGHDAITARGLIFGGFRHFRGVLLRLGMRTPEVRARLVASFSRGNSHQGHRHEGHRNYQKWSLAASSAVISGSLAYAPCASASKQRNAKDGLHGVFFALVYMHIQRPERGASGEPQGEATLLKKEILHPFFAAKRLTMRGSTAIASKSADRGACRRRAYRSASTRSSKMMTLVRNTNTHEPEDP